MLVEKTLGLIDGHPLNGRAAEAIFVDRYDLNKPHQKLRTAQGEVFAVSLEQGCTLEPGSVLFEDADRVVYVELADEECLVIKPQGTVQWARAAFNVGNMHHPAYIHEDCILVAYDAVLESVIKKLDVDYAREVRKLDGVRANVAQGEGHHHHHGDAHHNHHGGEV